MKKALEEHHVIKVLEEEFARKNGLTILYGTGKSVRVYSYNVNRPGLMLAGYESYFAVKRVQVIGSAEHDYLKKLTKEERKNTLDKFFKKDIPCVILARGYLPSEEMFAAAKTYGVPLFQSEQITADVTNTLVHYLNDLLAETQTMHGTLMDIYGTGVLIEGASGIGKSETALELLHRGHRLVSDDRVDFKRIKDELYGQSPEITRHFLEIRGVGIIDVKAMFGVGAVLVEKPLELLIELEKWDNQKEYERLGLEFKTEDILGVKVPKLLIPVEAGRNIAVVIEAATMDFRLKQQGYNSAKVLNERLSKK